MGRLRRCGFRAFDLSNVSRNGELAEVFEQQVEVQLVGRRWDEPEMFIEPPGRIVFCMDGKGADAREVRGLQCAPHGVFQEAGTKLTACRDWLTARRANNMMGTGWRARPFVSRSGASA